MKKQISIALQYESLFGKSKEYIRRGLRAKESSEMSEYQLWASLALELLSKAALATLHPCLVADPTHANSLFAAAGYSVGSDVKTIAAHTVFERLKYLSRHFDQDVCDYCKDLAIRRNAELHSGELAFTGIQIAPWEQQYWRTAEIILEIVGSDLDEWLGVDKSVTPREIAAKAAVARLAAAREHILKARALFHSRFKTKAQRAAAIKASINLRYAEYEDEFRFESDNYWEGKCPACESAAFYAGNFFEEEILANPDSEEPWLEMVQRVYLADEIVCPTCDLHLYGSDSLEGVGIDIAQTEIAHREMVYEPEYGNE
jgi:hypothetical protein